MHCWLLSVSPPEDESKLCQAVLEVAPKILPYAADVPGLLAQAQAEGKRILFEGAQVPCWIWQVVPILM